MLSAPREGVAVPEVTFLIKGLSTEYQMLFLCFYVTLKHYVLTLTLYYFST